MNASDSIVVTVITYSAISSAAFIVPPIEQLGSRYIAVTYKVPGTCSLWSTIGPYLVAVMALGDNTHVNITVKSPDANATLTGNSTGNSIVIEMNNTKTITLNKFQVIQVYTFAALDYIDHMNHNLLYCKRCIYRPQSC